MSFGDMIGQLLQQGMAGQTQTRSRLESTAGQSGGGLDQILGSLLGGAGGARSSAGGSLGNLAGMAQDFLGSKQAGGMSGAQVGGLGALVGAVLGGGGGAVKGAVGGSAMAILGSLALSALKNYQAQAAGAGSAQAAAAPPVTHAEIEAVSDPATEKLVLKAMIAAAKADGQVDQAEMQKLVGRIEGGGVSEAERQFVIDEMTRPLDVNEIAREVRTPAVAAEVYAASILAIDIDTEAERQYLRSLAQALHLDQGTVHRLHQMTGAPAV
jgi:uncharacterized membrane protein YebE (DUF533 family)